MKTEIMSLSQFLEVERNKKVEITKIDPNAIKLSLAIFTYMMLYSTTVHAAPFDAVGQRFFSYAKNFLYYGYLVMGCLQSFKEAQSGDYKGVWKVVAKCGAAYGVTAILPWLFREIDAAFSSLK
ncbi:hypothetical protein [Rhodopseudomonas parapalustris]